jgi:CheY-like chemotaxis protein
MKTILLVDDEKDIRESLANMLSHRTGASVCEAESGAQALKICAEKHLDVVFLDNGLPDMLGIDVLAKIKAMPGQGKVFMLTGQDDPALHEKAYVLGAAGYLTKPIVFGELLAALAAV